MDGNGWEWMGMMGMDGNGIIISYYGSFPHSRSEAPVSCYRSQVYSVALPYHPRLLWHSPQIAQAAW